MRAPIATLVALALVVPLVLAAPAGAQDLTSEVSRDPHADVATYEFHFDGPPRGVASLWFGLFITPPTPCAFGVDIGAGFSILQLSGINLTAQEFQSGLSCLQNGSIYGQFDLGEFDASAIIDIQIEIRREDAAPNGYWDFTSFFRESEDGQTLAIDTLPVCWQDPAAPSACGTSGADDVTSDDAVFQSWAGPGDDTLTYTGAGTDVFVDCGPGDDLVILDISGGDPNGRVTVDLGEGDDTIRIPTIDQLNDLAIIGGAGTTTIEIGDVTLGQPLTLIPQYPLNPLLGDPVLDLFLTQDPLGLPGIDVPLLDPLGGGSGTLPLPIPPDPRLGGFELATQAVVTNPVPVTVGGQSVIQFELQQPNPDGAPVQFSVQEQLTPQQPGEPPQLDLTASLFGHTGTDPLRVDASGAPPGATIRVQLSDPTFGHVIGTEGSDIVSIGTVASDGSEVTADPGTGIAPGGFAQLTGAPPITIEGRGGDDVIIGSGLADAIDGGDGQDQCIGRDGRDVLTGCENDERRIDSLLAQSAGAGSFAAVDGDDAVARAIAWTRVDDYRTDGGFAFLGRDDEFADSLAGGGAQGALDAPLLLNPRDQLDPRVSERLTEMQVQTVHVLGGPVAISQAVITALEEAGFTVERAAGADRVGTAIEIARTFLSSADTAVLARSSGDAEDPSRAFADSLAAGALAASGPHPLLLSRTSRLSDETGAYLTEAGIEQVLVIGGTAALGDQVIADLEALDINVTRVAGPGRIQTAAAVAPLTAADGTPQRMVVIDGFGRDAWVDGVSAARFGNPVLLWQDSAPENETVSWIGAAQARGSTVLCGATAPGACDIVAAFAGGPLPSGGLSGVSAPGSAGRLAAVASDDGVMCWMATSADGLVDALSYDLGTASGELQVTGVNEGNLVRGCTATDGVPDIDPESDTGVMTVDGVEVPLTASTVLTAVRDGVVSVDVLEGDGQVCAFALGGTTVSGIGDLDGPTGCAEGTVAAPRTATVGEDAITLFPL